MGNYFVMSMRYNKYNASDFGLIPSESNTAINPIDNSIWVKSKLYDFGWGQENGFYKTPLPDFDFLFEIILNGINKEDVYGAAAIILEKHADSLLSNCETIINDSTRIKDFKKLVDLFNLKSPTNRSPVLGKTFEQIENDYARWKAVSEKAKKTD